MAEGGVAGIDWRRGFALPVRPHLGDHPHRSLTKLSRIDVGDVTWLDPPQKVAPLSKPVLEKIDVEPGPVQ
jgi:hypothetical protein